MRTYKLFRVKDGKLYPLYVEAKRELPIGKWLLASIGEKADETHVKASGCGGKLALRPGFHSCFVPWTNWIGKRMNGELVQRKDTVWAECEVRGKHLKVDGGSKELLNGWYYFRTNSKQKDPWVISRELKIIRILTDAEVDDLCTAAGMVAQKRESEAA